MYRGISFEEARIGVSLSERCEQLLWSRAMIDERSGYTFIQPFCPVRPEESRGKDRLSRTPTVL